MTWPIIARLVATVTASCVASASLAMVLLRKERLSMVAWALVVLHLSVLFVRPASLIVSNASLIGVSAAVAVLLAGVIRTKGALVSFAVAASVADIISFTVGPTRALLDMTDTGPGSLISYLAVTIQVDGRFVPVVGVGDLLILSAFALTLRRLAGARWGAVAVPLSGLLLALAVGLIRGGAFGIPFMAGTLLLYLHWSPKVGARQPSEGSRQPELHP